MPANKKYLTKSPIVKVIKLFVGLVVGFLITVEMMIILGYFFNKEVVTTSYTFMGFVLWAVLFLASYAIKIYWHALLGSVVIVSVLALIIQIIG